MRGTAEGVLAGINWIKGPDVDRYSRHQHYPHFQYISSWLHRLMGLLQCHMSPFNKIRVIKLTKKNKTNIRFHGHAINWIKNRIVAKCFNLNEHFSPDHVSLNEKTVCAAFPILWEVSSSFWILLELCT